LTNQTIKITAVPVIRGERERGSKPVKWKVTKAVFAERELEEA